MATANVGITHGTNRVDINGEIPDDVAKAILKQITNLLVGNHTSDPGETPGPDAGTGP